MQNSASQVRRFWSFAVILLLCTPVVQGQTSHRRLAPPDKIPPALEALRRLQDKFSPESAPELHKRLQDAMKPKLMEGLRGALPPQAKPGGQPRPGSSDPLDLPTPPEPLDGRSQLPDLGQPNDVSPQELQSMLQDALQSLPQDKPELEQLFRAIPENLARGIKNFPDSLPDLPREPPGTPFELPKPQPGQQTPGHGPPKPRPHDIGNNPSGTDSMQRLIGEDWPGREPNDGREPAFRTPPSTLNPQHRHPGQFASGDQNRPQNRVQGMSGNPRQASGMSEEELQRALAAAERAAGRLPQGRPGEVVGPTPSPEPPQEPNDRLEALGQSNLSLKQQFNRVLERARRDAILSGKSGSDSEPSGLQRAIGDALAKSSTQIAKALDKDKQGRPKRGPQPRKPWDRLPRETAPKPRGPKLSEQFKSFSKATDSLFKNVTGPMDPVETGTSGGAAVEVSENSNWLTVAVLITVLCLMGVIGFWYARRRQQEALAAELKSLTLPGALATRQDVLRAFHVLAAWSAAAKNPWWPASRATSAMIEESPHARVALESLQIVYEEARYAPHEQPLNAAHLKTAQHALTMCLR